MEKQDMDTDTDTMRTRTPDMDTDMDADLQSKNELQIILLTTITNNLIRWGGQALAFRWRQMICLQTLVTGPVKTHTVDAAFPAQIKSYLSSTVPVT